MQQTNNEQINFLKRLYERKFYEPSSQTTTIDKVLNFQQKIQEFKVTKTHQHYQLIIDTTPLLEKTDSHRPKTNTVSHRSKLNKHSIIVNKQKQSLLSSSLQYFLSKAPKQEENMLAENISNHRTGSVGQNNQRKWSKINQRGRSYQINRAQHQSEGKILKAQIQNALQQYYLLKKERIRIRKQQASIDPKNNQLTFRSSVNNQHILKKRNNIDHRLINQVPQSFEKSSHRTISPNKLINSFKLNEIFKKKGEKSRVKVSETQRGSGRAALSGRRSNERKIVNFQDLILNLQIKPWNTVEVDYI